MTGRKERYSEDDLLRRVLFPESDEDWEAAKAELDAQPREPGRYKIAVQGKAQEFAWEGECPDCGKHLRARGISWGPDRPELHVGLHQSDDCPAWRNRLWRFWHHHTWGRIERRWKSWRWRRRARTERKAAGLDD